MVIPIWKKGISMGMARGTLLVLSCLSWAAAAVAGSSAQDVTFISIKVVRGKDTPAYIKNELAQDPAFAEWPFLEVRFSTETNLFEIKDGWRLVIPRATFCADWTEYVTDRGLIKPPPLVPPHMVLPMIDADVDTASFLTVDEYKRAIAEWTKGEKPLVYKIYLTARAEQIWSSYAIYRAYDLIDHPADVCVGIIGWVSPEDAAQRSNVMTIPKASIAAAVELERRMPPPPLSKGSAGSQK
jgi:hypothetical protein